MRKLRLAVIILLMLGGMVAVLALSGRGVYADTLFPLLSGAMVLALVAPAIWHQLRTEPAKTVQHLLIWAVLFLLVALAYTWFAPKRFKPRGPVEEARVLRIAPVPPRPA